MKTIITTATIRNIIGKCVVQTKHISRLAKLAMFSLVVYAVEELLFASEADVLAFVANPVPAFQKFVIESLVESSLIIKAGFYQLHNFLPWNALASMVKALQHV